LVPVLNSADSSREQITALRLVMTWLSVHWEALIGGVRFGRVPWLNTAKLGVVAV
jgi:hypothetical protein